MKTNTQSAIAEIQRKNLMPNETTDLSLSRLGVSRRIDRLGRFVIPKEIRDLAGLDIGDYLFVSAVTDKEGKLRGILLEPIDWLHGHFPHFDEALSQMTLNDDLDDE